MDSTASVLLVFQKFDLKGSMRNRLVNTAGKQAEEELVLLDENLLKCKSSTLRLFWKKRKRLRKKKEKGQHMEPKKKERKKSLIRVCNSISTG